MVVDNVRLVHSVWATLVLALSHPLAPLFLDPQVSHLGELTTRTVRDKFARLNQASRSAWACMHRLAVTAATLA